MMTSTRLDLIKRLSEAPFSPDGTPSDKHLQETKRDAHAVGFQLGHDFATGFERYAHDGDDWVNREGENVHAYVSECFENYSQYSPWEVTAACWNSFGGWAHEIWAAFHAGMIEGATGVDSGD